jgi:hypothetical protein
MSDPRIDGSNPTDPRLLAAFAELRAESAAPARPDAVAAARRAMHMAAAERAGHRGMAPLLDRARRLLTPHRLMAGAAGATLGLAAVTALGWNAPAGAPLHAVEVAHEQIALALPGIDRVSLDLNYAEVRLAQAAGGDSPGDALDEAQRLLDDAHSHLPGDHGAAVWTRWQSDSHRLDDLRRAGGHGAGDDHGAAQPAGGGAAAPGGDGRSGADDGSRGSTTTTSTSTTASRSGEDGGRDGGGGSSTSTSTQTESRSASSSTSTSGGDGGSSSSSSSSTSSSSGGRDSGSGH